jgi:hypothetical protein
VDGGVFINYRGEDSYSYGVWLHTELSRRFGPELVFLDSVSIPAGADFVEQLLGQVRRSAVVLAVIGPRWLAADRPGGGRRIDDPADWIRRELVEAFRAGVRVVPLLTDGAQMPAEDDLPAELAVLARRQFLRLRHRDAAADLARLASELAEMDPRLGAAAAARVSVPDDGSGREESVADRLAAAVRDQWVRAADERRLLSPAPVPVGWSLTGLAVAGPVTAAVAQPPRFAPVPGFEVVTEEVLRAGGGRVELHAAYAGVGSGRLVVVGRPGAGKSGAGVLLVLDALAHRDALAASARARIPVPVLFTLHGWDPDQQGFEEWLVGRLSGTYPVFGGRAGRARAAGLVAAGGVSVVLDGLDEMSRTLRPIALRALSQQARVRVVLLTRSAEMLAAAGTDFLLGAAAVELHPVSAAHAGAYLERALPGPPPAGWDRLVGQLRTDPAGPLARALSTPLTLALLRDTYRADDDLHPLLALAAHADPLAVEDHLLDRVLTAAYAHHPGQPPPRYPLARAEPALRYLACQLTQRGTRDLAWWQIPQWAPSRPRTKANNWVSSVGFALTGGPAMSNGNWPEFKTIYLQHSQMPRRLRRWTPLDRERVLDWPAAAAAAGGTGGSAWGLFWIWDGPVPGLIAGLAAALWSALIVGLVAGQHRPGVGDASAADPIESWRNDRTYGLVTGLGYGLGHGPVMWTLVLHRHGLGFGLLAGLTLGFLTRISTQLIRRKGWALRWLGTAARGAGLLPWSGWPVWGQVSSKWRRWLFHQGTVVSVGRSAWRRTGV